MVAFACLGRVSALAELVSLGMVCRKILGYGSLWRSHRYFSALWQVLFCVVGQVRKEFVNFGEWPCGKLSQLKLRLHMLFLGFGFVLKSDYIL